MKQMKFTRKSKNILRKNVCVSPKTKSRNSKESANFYFIKNKGFQGNSSAAIVPPSPVAMRACPQGNNLDNNATIDYVS